MFLRSSPSPPDTMTDNRSAVRQLISRSQSEFTNSYNHNNDPDADIDEVCDAFGRTEIQENNGGHDSTPQRPKQQSKMRRNRKARSLYGVSPHCKFGPKGSLADNTASLLTIPDPGCQKLKWHKSPLTVLVVRKMFDESIIIPFRDLIVWLIEEKNMVVYVETKVLEETSRQFSADGLEIASKIQTFKEGEDDLTDKIDFIVCLGGDGTLLYASSLFQQSVPPVMAFNMGSLGFLTPFHFCNFKEQVENVLQGEASLLLRYRLKCVVCKQGSECSRIPHVKNIDKKCGTTHILVLNEVVIDRGPCPYLCNIDLYIESRLVTSVQGDGLIISTPTGSTAYAVAAGASMIHPNVPCILITPICPHSLSFRPVVVPAGVEIKIMVSPEARNNAWVSFDGRNRQEIRQGDTLRITTATYPVPSVCAKNQIDDWFDGLADCLHWNVRRQQKSLPSLPSTTSLDSVILDPDSN